jgi:hypothetical protein
MDSSRLAESWRTRYQEEVWTGALELSALQDVCREADRQNERRCSVSSLRSRTGDHFPRYECYRLGGGGGGGGVGGGDVGRMSFLPVSGPPRREPELSIGGRFGTGCGAFAPISLLLFFPSFPRRTAMPTHKPERLDFEPFPSFSRSAWECRLRRSASSSRRPSQEDAGASQTAFPRRTVGTRERSSTE